MSLRETNLSVNELITSLETGCSGIPSSTLVRELGVIAAFGIFGIEEMKKAERKLCEIILQNNPTNDKKISEEMCVAGTYLMLIGNPSKEIIDALDHFKKNPDNAKIVKSCMAP